MTTQNATPNRTLAMPIPDDCTDLYASGWAYGDWHVSNGGNLNADAPTDWHEEKVNGFRDRLTAERIDNKPHRPAMPQNLRSVLESLPQLPQRQDSTAAQLADLRVIANRLGLYDAADAIKTMLGRQ